MTESNVHPRRRRTRWGLRRVSVAMLVLGLVLVVVTSGVIRSASDQDQRALLSQQATLAAGSVASLASQVKSVLDSATAAAVAVHDPVAFRALMGAEAPYFSSFVVVHRQADGFNPLLTVGHPAVDVRQAPAGLRRELLALTPGEFDVTGFTVAGKARVLGVAERSGVDRSTIVYAEVPLPAYTQATGPSADLQYAVYTDSSERLSSLVLASTAHLPLTGRRAIIAVPLDGSSVEGKPLLGPQPGSVRLPGDHLLMVVTAAGRLGGVLMADLWMLLLVFGLLALLGGILAVEIVQRRRDEALVMVADLEMKNDALDAALEERAEAERERSMMEVRLRAAQRLETVGKLAGGIAHDFNNLLAVILNYARFVIDDIGDHPVRGDVEEIERAARRAAELTHQLLVFSRQDIVEPAVVDVNAIVAGMDRLLERTLGEDIEVQS
ncbi:MAG TPA: histidine kinase dimerization/phospho-acceptor domain-containing protein, partial [Acidimicrobiales bacterium]